MLPLPISIGILASGGKSHCCSCQQRWSLSHICPGSSPGLNRCLRLVAVVKTLRPHCRGPAWGRSCMPCCASRKTKPNQNVKSSPTLQMYPGSHLTCQRMGCRLPAIPWCPQAPGWGCLGLHGRGLWADAGRLLQAVVKNCQLSKQDLFTSAQRKAFDLLRKHKRRISWLIVWGE